MEIFTIKKLWDLRGELDNAIITKDYDKIKLVKGKYQNLVEGERFFSRSFICYNHGFWTESERSSHNFLNINSILANIEAYEKRYIDGEDVSTKLKVQFTTGFLAEEIWILRAMYDKFLLNSVKENNEVQTQQNMILGRVVLDKLRDLATREETEDYHSEILPILKDVAEGYRTVYKNNKPKIDYNTLSDDYIERKK